jgi:hypothetical protein
MYGPIPCWCIVPPSRRGPQVASGYRNRQVDGSTSRCHCYTVVSAETRIAHDEQGYYVRGSIVLRDAVDADLAGDVPTDVQRRKVTDQVPNRP